VGAQGWLAGAARWRGAETFPGSGCDAGPPLKPGRQALIYSRFNPMGRFVIVAYKPKPGRDEALARTVQKHIRVLREQELVTDAPASIMRARDGTILEVFEWHSAEAIEQAHSNPVVQALWAEFAEVCDYVPLATLTEANQLFAEFEVAGPPELEISKHSA
jgi:quinol monooxygenase YgiN